MKNTFFTCLFLLAFSAAQSQNCSTEITSTAGNTGLVLTAHFSASDPGVTAGKYLWSNGSTFPHITVFHAGNYCVTITGTNGCTASDCFDVFLSAGLTVNVVKSNNAVAALAEVFLIKYDTVQGGILTALDTLTTNPNGVVEFQNVPPGHYLVKAALLPTDVDYHHFLPTYHHHNLFWSDATPVLMDVISPNVFGPTIKIALIPGINPGGPGFIGGLVVQGANFAGNDDRGEGDPIAGVSIILEMLDGTAVTATKTAANGKYVFENLAYGTYKVSIEIPGIPVVSKIVTIGASNPEIYTINFKADDDSAIFTSQKSPEFEGLNISPNPTSDAVRVSFPDQIFNLVLTNSTGQIISQTFENQSFGQIEMQFLPQGIYFLTVNSGNKIYTERIFKL